MIYYFHHEAESEHYDAVSFYESRQNGLGEKYIIEFEGVMDDIVQSPRTFRIERKPDIRIAHLPRFPYTITYREREGKVQVIAVAHNRRRPGYWTKRL